MKEERLLPCKPVVVVRHTTGFVPQVGKGINPVAFPHGGMNNKSVLINMSIDTVASLRLHSATSLRTTLSASLVFACYRFVYVLCFVIFLKFH